MVALRPQRRTWACPTPEKPDALKEALRGGGWLWASTAPCSNLDPQEPVRMMFPFQKVLS